MTIYSLDKNGLKKADKDFQKTEYGKRQYTCNFAPSVTGMVIAIVFLILGLCFSFMNCSMCGMSGAAAGWYKWCIVGSFSMISLVCLVFSLILFFAGKKFYLKELRKFIESTNE